LTDSTLAIVTIGAEVAIITDITIIGELTSLHRIAAIVGAHIAIITGQHIRARLADALTTDISKGTAIVIRAGSVVEFMHAPFSLAAEIFGTGIVIITIFGSSKTNTSVAFVIYGA